jgi:hypothetical protein
LINGKREGILWLRSNFFIRVWKTAKEGFRSTFLPVVSHSFLDGFGFSLFKKIFLKNFT